MKHGTKLFLISLLTLVVLLLAAAGCYVIYVFSSYYRVEDRQQLQVHAAAEQPVETGVPLTIMSYNIGFGAYSDDYSFFMDGGKESRVRSPEDLYTNIGGAMEALQAVDPDFILIQEVDQDGTRSHHIDERQLVQAAFPAKTWVYAQNYDSPYLFWPLTEPHGANKAGVMTLSDYAITSALRRSLPIEDGFMKLVDLDRCYAVHRIPTADGRELVLINFHLSAYTSDGKIAEEQLEMLFADMQQERAAGNYVIAGGDFNKDLLGNSDEVFGISFGDANWAQPIPAELVPADIRIVAPFDPAAPVPSCRNADRPHGTGDFLLTVDGFLTSDNVEVLDSRVMDTGFRWSDHNPVQMAFVLTPQPA